MLDVTPTITWNAISLRYRNAFDTDNDYDHPGGCHRRDIQGRRAPLGFRADRARLERRRGVLYGHPTRLQVSLQARAEYCSGFRIRHGTQPPIASSRDCFTRGTSWPAPPNPPGKLAAGRPVASLRNIRPRPFPARTRDSARQGGRCRARPCPGASMPGSPWTLPVRLAAGQAEAPRGQCLSATIGCGAKSSAARAQLLHQKNRPPPRRQGHDPATPDVAIDRPGLAGGRRHPRRCGAHEGAAQMATGRLWKRPTAGWPQRAPPHRDVEGSAPLREHGGVGAVIGRPLPPNMAQAGRSSRRSRRRAIG